MSEVWHIYVGLLQALREQDIEADILAGTSAGAMVGALYAKGYSMQQMVDAFRATPLFSPRNITIFKPGIRGMATKRAKSAKS